MKHDNINITDTSKILPLDDNSSLACFGFPLSEDLEIFVNVFSYMAQAFKADIDFGFIDQNISSDDLEIITNSITTAEIIIIFLLTDTEKDIELPLAKFNEIISKIAGIRNTVLVHNLAGKDNIPHSICTIQIKNTTDDSIANLIINLLGKDKTGFLPHN